MEYIQEFYEETNHSKWLNMYAKYIKKYREIKSNDLQQANDFVFKHINWLFDKN